MSDENKKIDNIDGKSTPSEETVERIEQIQAADPKVQTTSEPSDPPAAELQEQQEKEEKAKAAAKAREERAKARAAKQEAAEPSEEKPKEPSRNQPRLDRAVQLIKENISEAAVEEAFINERDRDLPYLIIKPQFWTECAALLKDHEELQLNYLRNVSGTDQESHLEVAYHLVSLSTKQEFCVKIKTDRDQPSIPSAVDAWSTANWNEREIYDLLGIVFTGHPDLRRIMMPDDWVGHPLRKDYIPIDPEV
ncbi:NADH-quinone oxidoreductase subunit C [Ferviditalea candida]|uniref:NADH-quinone oxidoreductase subunit C n=1 Tax=Ferviditalea candida TaxID=3108399 RepID=A0ABU5ZLI2_9BACL|nr:NADH-quinone oxidoreductase subunit C [Paenibacillaceae bacterium T2]